MRLEDALMSMSATCMATTAIPEVGWLISNAIETANLTLKVIAMH